MSINKFEKQLKKTLEERRIQPNGKAWADLHDRLETAQKSSKRKRFGYYGIAVSACFLLFLGWWQFQADTPFRTPTSKRPFIQPLKPFYSEPTVIHSEAVEITEPLLLVSALPSGLNEIKKILKPETPIIKENFISKEEKEITENTSEKPPTTTPTQKEATVITDKDIDALLASAQHKISIQNTPFQQKQLKIKATALLQEVEEEHLDPSLRKQLFKMALDGIAFVKQRNK